MVHISIYENRFHQCDWKKFYRDNEEAIPGNMQVVRGKFISTHYLVDANHAGENEARRSHTGILLFCNSAPIIWFSKRQNLVEA